MSSALPVQFERGGPRGEEGMLVWLWSAQQEAISNGVERRRTSIHHGKNIHALGCRNRVHVDYATD